MKKVVLAGGTGNLGALLSAAFVDRGWEVIILTRQSGTQRVGKVSYIYWDGENVGDWCHALEGVETIINLSGKSIQCRFTEANKKVLYDSRILPTRVLGLAIARLHVKPKLWINFSGVSIFNALEDLQDEQSDKVGTGFLATLSRDWEEAFFDNEIPTVDKVALRISPVLLKESGFYAELLPLVKMGLGGKVADGKQWMNWIHGKDLVSLIFWIIAQPSPSKIYHACSPNPSSNTCFMQTFRKEVGVSMGLPLPRFMAQLGAFVKGVDASLLLDSVPVTTTSTIQEGFVFQFPNAEIALQDLLK